MYFVWKIQDINNGKEKRAVGTKRANHCGHSIKRQDGCNGSAAACGKLKVLPDGMRSMQIYSKLSIWRSGKFKLAGRHYIGNYGIPVYRDSAAVSLLFLAKVRRGNFVLREWQLLSTQDISRNNLGEQGQICKVTGDSIVLNSGIKDD
eukprot:Plantae.Rhodophyta-Hildenbrandia_rubra.ctg9961.p1 GENE.Plantae.Rhodophyta-Hildenbrandia_rubra.ctg9961~~Plantae.Rhodophyta-Hildenbrandia_rubra.ctg9961.p1  ORF type:complete len:148 (-),score=12.72 Plantae.Rhodophyta-Hildenbrandia_rubra.ctg9961:1297-1740(-)